MCNGVAVTFPGVQVKMIGNKLFVALMAVLALAGCTTESWYKGFQQSSESRCRNQPPGESQRCLDDLNRKSYSEYEKEREKERSGQKQ